MDQTSLHRMDPVALGVRLRLRLARESRELTQQEAADLLGVARTTMVAIEKGTRRLQPAELVLLAESYGRDLSELLQGGTPAEDFSVQLRGVLLPAGAEGDQLPKHIEQFERLCEDYLRLEEICGTPLRRRDPQLYEIGGVDPELAGEDVAVIERRRLGLGEGPLLNLREILDNDVGLRVFQPELPSSVAGMFGLTERLGGCIAVNLRHPPERRRASLAHEYGHFLTSRHRSEVLYLDRYERRPAEERFAEAFARAFLLHPEGLRRRFLELQRQRNGAPTHGDLVRLAHFYAVSVEAMTRRLEELRLIPAGVWDRLRQQRFGVEKARKILGLGPVPADNGLLPLRFVALAVEAWQKKDLSEGQLSRLLRTDRVGARETIEMIEGSQPDESWRSSCVSLRSWMTARHLLALSPPFAATVSLPTIARRFGFSLNGHRTSSSSKRRRFSSSGVGAGS